MPNPMSLRSEISLRTLRVFTPSVSASSVAATCAVARCSTSSSSKLLAR